MTKAVEKPSTDRCAIMTTAEEDAAERQRLLAKFPDRSSGDIHFDKPLFPPEPAFPPPTVEIEIVLPPRDRPADPRITEIAERTRIGVKEMKAARAKGIVLPPLRPAAECEIEAVARLLPFKRYRWEQERRARGVVDLRPRPDRDGTPRKRVAPVEDHPQFHVYVHPRLPEILAAARKRGPSVARDDGWPGQAGPSRKNGEGVAQAEGENRANAERENRANADEERHADPEKERRANAERENRANAEGESHVEARAEGHAMPEVLAADCIAGTHFAHPDRIAPVPATPTFPLFSTSPGLTGGPMVTLPQRIQKEHRAGLRLTWKQEPPKPKPRFHPNGMLIIDETSMKLLLPEPAGSKPKPKLTLVPR